MRTPEQPPHDERDGKVKPDKDVGTRNDEIAEDGVIRRIRHPVVAIGRRGDALAQNIVPARLPVRTMMQRVDLDVSYAQGSCELGREGRLAAAAWAGDRDPSQS